MPYLAEKCLLKQSAIFVPHPDYSGRLPCARSGGRCGICLSLRVPTMQSRGLVKYMMVVKFLTLRLICLTLGCVSEKRNDDLKILKFSGNIPINIQGGKVIRLQKGSPSQRLGRKVTGLSSSQMDMATGLPGGLKKPPPSFKSRFFAPQWSCRSAP